MVGKFSSEHSDQKSRDYRLGDILRGEAEENVLRKDFTVKERVAIGTTLEEKEKEKAQKRREATQIKEGKPPGPEKFTEPEKGEALEKVAVADGIMLQVDEQLSRLPREQRERVIWVLDTAHQIRFDTVRGIVGKLKEFNLSTIKVDLNYVGSQAYNHFRLRN